MSAQPHWQPVDADTGDLLTLLADDGTIPTDNEWEVYLAAVREAADDAGIVRPNALRPLLRGRVKPCRVGAFTRRALLAGVLVRTGGYEVSDDTASRNGGKPAPVMRWVGAS